MSTHTSFNVEDTEAFLFELQQLQEIIQHDWTGVLNQWENLKIVWKDENFRIFEEKFSDLAVSYQMTEAECERHIAFLNQQILIANKLQPALSNLITNVLQPAISSSASPPSANALSSLSPEHNSPAIIDQAFLNEIAPIVDQAKDALQTIIKKAASGIRLASEKSGMALSVVLLFSRTLSFAIATPMNEIVLPLIDLNNRILAAQGMPTANDPIVKLFNEFAEQSDKYLGEYAELGSRDAEHKRSKQEEWERQSQVSRSPSTTIVDHDSLE